MRAAMLDADVGDDVYGEDPTTNRLEKICAERMGFEAGLFVASGTQSNLAALLAHCGRGDEYIAGQDAHTYRFEGGGGAALGGIQPQPLPFRSDGTLDLEDVEAAIKPDDYHFARTRLLCLENTQGGRPIGPDYFAQARALANRTGLRVHLDGARLFNAAVALDVDIDDITRHCDSVSVCLSKGLGAPVGSVLCGESDFIEAARRWRKVLGGGMRQCGILAAAGIYALEHNVERLAEDHHRARELVAGLNAAGLAADQRTNMVYVAGIEPGRMRDHMAAGGVRVSGPRWVVHLDVDDENIRHVVATAAGLTAYRTSAGPRP